MPSFPFFLNLFLLIFLLLNATVQSNTCSTEGFMELSLLETKTGTNNNGQTTGLAESVETRWIITEGDKRFSDCSSTLTEVLVGADIRTETGNRNQYPRIEIWRETGKGRKGRKGRKRERSRSYERTKTRTKSKSIEVNKGKLILSPHNFTTNGLYRYTLPTPLIIGDDDRDYRLGVFQPPDDRSVVRFYKVTGTGESGRVNDRDIYEYSIKKSREITIETSSILIHPINMSMLIIMNFINNYFSKL